MEAISTQEAVELGATSLPLFGKLFFPRTFRQESPGFHHTIGDALYSHDRYNAFAVHRDGAKTTLLRVYAAQRVAFNLSRTIMFVSVSQAHALFSVRWLRRQVTYNKRWANTFGLVPGKKWTDEWCEVECKLVQDPDDPTQPVIVTVLAAGITGQIRGFNPDDFRPDLILMDDVLSDENTATIEQRKKIEQLIFGALLNSLAPASEMPLAKAVMLQTPMHKEDALSTVLKDPEWHPVVVSCFDKNGESVWPERYPTAELVKAKEAAIRRSQYRIWMREKECTLVSGEEQAIDVTRFRYYDVAPEQMDVVISMDPASAETRTADEFAIGAIGFKGPDVYVLDYTSEQAVMPDAACNDFFNLVLLYSPRKAVVESVSYQRIMAWYLKEEMKKRRLYVAVQELQVGRLSNADRIMQTIPGLVAFGHFYVRPSHTKLIKQADDYDPQVKDIKDDILTMIANAIISSNPGLRALLSKGSDGQPNAVYDVLDESEYQPIRRRACP